jgi:hypothetical protein
LERTRVFGDKTAALQDLIRKNSNKFRVPPIGPIGAYIKIKDERWANAIENCIAK